MLWAFQWSPRLERSFSNISAIHPAKLWAGLILASIVCLSIFWLGALRFRAAIALSVTVSGAVEMVIQLLLLLTFQVLEGFVYLQLALIIAFFMAGIGIGTAAVSWWEHRHPTKRFSISTFIRIQALFSLFPLLLILLLVLIHESFRDALTSATIRWIFSALSFAGGFLGGSHFSLGVLAYADSGTPSERIGGTLYALDLLGAVGGVLLASFFIMPVYGLINTLILLSIISFVCLLALLRHP
jgi:spermidine synthase